jgi:non-ribosomal peptide synthase protein (TIGR01720 family)
MERVGVEDDFFALGGDSILSIQVVSRARGHGLALTPRQLFEHPTIAGLARAAGRLEAVPAAEQGPVEGPVRLTPIQHRFFALRTPEPHHWNLSVLFEARERLDAAALERAVERMAEHHDALRMRFWRQDDGWRQENQGPGSGRRLARVDLSGLDEPEQAREVSRQSSRAQGSLDLERGWVFRVVDFDRGAGRTGRLLVVVHHLVIDGVSWRILLEDLQRAYSGGNAALPPKTTSFREWARRLARHAADGGFDGELGYWLAPERETVKPLPDDVPGGDDTAAREERVSARLDEEETRLLLRDVPAAYRTGIDDVLLTALARVLGRWTGGKQVLVDVEGHGREELFGDVDLSRTVGWFTTIFPVLLDVADHADPGDALKAVKEQLRAVPNRGIGHGALRWLSPRGDVREKLDALPAAQVRFEYLGQFGQAAGEEGLLSLAPEPAGAATSARAPRRHPLVVNGVVMGGRLQIGWEYGGGRYRRETVEALARDYLAELRALIAHCTGDGAGGSTPSDFPLAEVDAETLRLLEEQMAGNDA